MRPRRLLYKLLQKQRRRDGPAAFGLGQIQQVSDASLDGAAVLALQGHVPDFLTGPRGGLLQLAEQRLVRRVQSAHFLTQTHNTGTYQRWYIFQNNRKYTYKRQRTGQTTIKYTKRRTLPVSVARSTMASTCSFSAYTSASASVSLPSASVLMTYTGEIK